jgi:hypothetical protein
VPWSALLEAPDKFLEPCYLPAGVRLTEISKMKSETLNACLRHWLERVENGDTAFHFKAVEDVHLRAGKSLKKRPAPTSDDESSKADHSASHLGSHTSGVDGGDDDDDDEDSPKSVVNPVQEGTGKGKNKALLPSWYTYFIAGSSWLNCNMHF